MEGIDAHGHIRSDIRKLRSKFKTRPNVAVILVTMNCSSNFFTGLTVARALMGDIGINFDRRALQVTSPLHHLPKGNATLTREQNRSISAVLVFDGPGGRHCLFVNPFADHPFPNTVFPGVTVIPLDRSAHGEALKTLSTFMFWPICKSGT